MAVAAVLFDFGGVLTTSPFEAFARFEQEQGLPPGFLRRVNATDAHDNAWAHLERSAIGLDEFDRRFADESARLGHRVPGREVLALLAGDLRPSMVAAVRSLRGRYRTGLLTNNFVVADAGGSAPHGELLDLFDAVVESSRVGVRKPEPRFYELACELLDIEASEAVFLDDLGVNLKPARAMGMRTIKVESAEQALAELAEILGHPVTPRS